MTNLDSYTAGVAATHTPILGNVLWYHVTGVLIPHADMVSAFEGSPLEGELPPKPRDGDCFKRLCSKAERRKVETDDPNILKNVLIRQVSTPVEDLIIRRIVVEEVTPSNRRIDFRQVLDVQFDRRTSYISVRPVTDSQGLTINDPIAIDVARQIQNQFAVEKGCLNSYAIREWIRHRIAALGATIVRPGGGVYFTAADHEDTVKKLEAFVESLPGGSSFHYLPLIDTDKQREMLKAAFESESVGEIDALIAEIGDILGDPDKKITQDAFVKLAERHQFLMNKVDDYSGLLKTNLDEVDVRLAMFKKGMDRLAPRIKVKKEKA